MMLIKIPTLNCVSTVNIILSTLVPSKAEADAVNGSSEESKYLDFIQLMLPPAQKEIDQEVTKYGGVLLMLLIERCIVCYLIRIVLRSLHCKCFDVLSKFDVWQSAELPSQ